MESSLSGRRILVVEDEYWVAADLRRALEARQAIVVGPTGSLERGNQLVSEQPLDAAVLDINLRGAPSYPIAQALRQRAVPYVFLTGYEGWSLPAEEQGAPLLTKPCPTERVCKALERVVCADSRT